MLLQTGWEKGVVRREHSYKAGKSGLRPRHGRKWGLRPQPPPWDASLPGAVRSGYMLATTLLFLHAFNLIWSIQLAGGVAIADQGVLEIKPRV